MKYRSSGQSNMLREELKKKNQIDFFMLEDDVGSWIE